MGRIRYVHITLSVIIVAVLTCGCAMNAGKDNEYRQWESHLQQVEECCLCGEQKESMLNYYQQYDSIGLIALNEWYIIDFGLAEKKDGEHVVQGNGSNFSYRVEAMPGRGMSHIIITFEKEFDTTVIQQIMCQPCLDLVSETVTDIPFCIVDYQTMEIYPIQEMPHKYFVRDYWIETSHSENVVEIEVYYLPEKP